MNLRSWVGMTLTVQAVGVAPLHALIETRWLIASAILGIIGVILLMYRRDRNLYDPSIAPNGDLYPGADSEYTGSQVTDLLGRIDDHD